MSNNQPQQPATPNPNNFSPNHRNEEGQQVPGRQEDLPRPPDDSKPAHLKGASPHPNPPDQVAPTPPSISK